MHLAGSTNNELCAAVPTVFHPRPNYDPRNWKPVGSPYTNYGERPHTA